MQGINLRKMVRLCYGPRHPSSTRSTDPTPRYALRIWHRHHQHGSHWALSGSDSDDETPDLAPKDVPVGCLVVYVGTERRRYVIHAHYLSHPLFKALLQRSAEEFGFHHEGGLLIACEVFVFEHLLRLIENHDTRTRYADIESMMDFYASTSPTTVALSRPLLGGFDKICPALLEGDMNLRA